MPQKVLIVDDSVTIRRMVATALNGAGYTVLEAGHGREALTCLEGQSVDVVISDVNMPVMDGLTFVKTLRQTPAGSRVPILMLTTEMDPSVKEQARAAGATAWLRKPCDAPKLLDALTRVLQKAA